VVDEHPLADPRTGMNFDTSDPAAELADQPRQQRHL
jgi:hypothetical protein